MEASAEFESRVEVSEMSELPEKAAVCEREEESRKSRGNRM
jgi:hypothetical protein